MNFEQVSGYGMEVDFIMKIRSRNVISNRVWNVGG